MAPAAANGDPHRPTRVSTASFTYRELIGPYLTEPGWTGGLTPMDADRDALPIGNKALRQRVLQDGRVGGILVWNRTADTEGGHLIMLTGQTCSEERRVVKNATWMTSCGAVYAASRVGLGSYKRCPDFKFRDGGRDGDLHFAWLLSNDRDVEGLRR